MNNVRTLFIDTPWRAQAHKWDLNEDGLVNYHDEWIHPSEVVEHFEDDYPMFTMLRAAVCERLIVEGEEKPYRWVELERYF